MYAVFQEASTSEYIVSYNKNGGSGTMVGDMVEENGKFTLENCTYIAPEGYKFKAWAIGSVNGEQKQPGEQITITADTDVYAIWEVIPHECSGVLESGQGATCTVDGWKDYYLWVLASSMVRSITILAKHRKNIRLCNVFGCQVINIRNQATPHNTYRFSKSIIK